MKKKNTGLDEKKPYANFASVTMCTFIMFNSDTRGEKQLNP